MSNMPTAPIEALINWLEVHAEQWGTSPTQIGITAAKAAAFEALVVEARKMITAAQVARSAAKDATLAQTQALRDARNDASDLINTIKSFIEASGNESLWVTAGLTPPAPRGVVPPPNAPTNLVASLDTDGNLTLSWKATQPRGATGTVYSIRRAFNGGTNYTLLDTVGEKMFIDQTVPLGTQQVSYRVIARRLGQESPASGTLTVQFGRVQGPGLTIVSETFNGKPVNFNNAQAA